MTLIYARGAAARGRGGGGGGNTWRRSAATNDWADRGPARPMTARTGCRASHARGGGTGRRRACAGGREEDGRSLKRADGPVHRAVAHRLDVGTFTNVFFFFSSFPTANRRIFLQYIINIVVRVFYLYFIFFT